MHASSLVQYRTVTPDDLPALKQLGLKAWAVVSNQLTPDNREKLYQNLSSDRTYQLLLDQSRGFVCTDMQGTIIGMAYLVSRGHPTEIYDKDWCYIRLVSVDPDHAGKGIGRQLTQLCLEWARETGERTIALHTSEMMPAARHIYESMGVFHSAGTGAPFGKTLLVVPAFVAHRIGPADDHWEYDRYHNFYVIR